MNIEDLDNLEMGCELISNDGDIFYYISHNHHVLYLSKQIVKPTVPAAPYHISYCKILTTRSDIRENKIDKILK